MATRKPRAVPAPSEDDTTDLVVPLTPNGNQRSELAEARVKRDTTRRAEALSLLLAGLTYDQIATRLEISQDEAWQVVSRALADRPAAGVDEMRQVENARLDRAQAAIWSEVIGGDHNAIRTYLSISQRRAKLNGLDAPFQIEMSAHVKVEMQQALMELQQVVLGEVLSSDDSAFE